MIRIFGVLFFLASFSTVAFSPLMGKYNVVGASCDGESFLWKKHSHIIFTGNKMVIQGDLDELSSQGECTFSDIYELKGSESDLKNVDKGIFEVSSEIHPVERKVICTGGTSEKKVTVEKIEKPLTYVKAKKSGRTVYVTIKERNLCQNNVILELSH